METPVWSVSGSGQFEFGNVHNSTEGREERGRRAASQENPAAWLCPWRGASGADSEKQRSIVSLVPLYISRSTMFPPKAAALLLLQHLPKKKEHVLFQ